jgi:hypothetical protein
MKAYAPAIIAAVISVAAIVASSALAIFGKIDGNAAMALLSAVVGGGLVHAGGSLSGPSA